MDILKKNLKILKKITKWHVAVIVYDH